LQSAAQRGRETTSDDYVAVPNALDNHLWVNSAVSGDSVTMAATWCSTARVSGAALACTLAMAVGGCSTVSGFSGIPRPGYQNDGSYVLSSEEQGLGCRELQERQLGLQQQLQALPQKALTQMQQLPATVADAWGRLVGSTDKGVPALAEYNEAKAEAAAVDQSLARKGCGGVETAAIKR
jgi:hypothetical protein